MSDMDTDSRAEEFVNALNGAETVKVTRQQLADYQSGNSGYHFVPVSSYPDGVQPLTNEKGCLFTTPDIMTRIVS